jgi:hypothetical protein
LEEGRGGDMGKGSGNGGGLKKGIE